MTTMRPTAVRRTAAHVIVTLVLIMLAAALFVVIEMPFVG
jgi:hypothetical protein